MYNPFKTIFSVILGVVVVVILAGSFTSVDQGERALVTRFGKTIKTLEPGLRYVGILNHVTKFQTRNAKYDTTATAGTIDLQPVGIDVSVNYEIEKEAISNIYATFGTDYISRIFTQNVQESVKSVSARYQASELITKRDEFKAEVIKKLTDTVNKYVIVTDVTINDVQLSDAFMAAVEAKVAAEQKTAEERNILEQKKLQAEAIKVQAQAVNAQGGAEYVQLKAIEKWNGVLPATMAQGSIPFLNLK